MTVWQYRSVVIVSERNEQGFQAALDSYGEKGWELVSLSHEESRIVIGGFGQWNWNSTSYRATFKRPSEEH